MSPRVDDHAENRETFSTLDMTTANKITILRILTIPFFIVQVLYYIDNGGESHRWLAFASFLIAAICDGVDGYIARRFNQRSELGAILDPLADKLLLASAIVVLSLHNEPRLARIPLWLTAMILGRDVILTLGLAVIHYTCGKVTVRPILIGKAATVFQMVTVSWILLKWDAASLRIWFLGAGVCTGISGLFYIWEGVRQLSASPTSAASPDQPGSRFAADRHTETESR
ncbi:MAG: CDP-alcohol phosphatidyltransferase family protein [Verrucomicrobia bacterium]|nr:CDP-alcohol phosphatidyltransferase family protein [Verrucomicrobiota bacterium]